MKIFQQTGSVEPKRGGNNNRTSRTDDVIEYVEFLKSVKPSIYPNETRKKLVENRVCLAENVPSNASVSRIMTDDLGYSYKILRPIPAETDRPDVQEKVVRYLADVCDIDVNNMHFFYESSLLELLEIEKGVIVLSDSRPTKYKSIHQTQLTLSTCYIMYME